MVGFIVDNLLVILIILIVLAIIIIAVRDDLKVVTYNIFSNKVSNEITIALLTDLHSCCYGKDQQELLGILEKHQPDVVLFGGDIFDDRTGIKNSLDLVSLVSQKNNCLYVTGNHEARINHIDVVKSLVSSYAVTVLDGKNKIVNVKSSIVQIFGVDDPEIDIDEYERQLDKCKDNIDNSLFSILLVHRPEQIAEYEKCGFDLVVAGHTHGGQVRIPFVINGLYSSYQGFFPKYAGGLYEINKTKMIVSRGLARRHVLVPRVFNRPEFVIIKIKPKK